MLFSLVLAVASKEVELWQTFDDFAPRRLMEDGEEVEDHEEPEMDGDEDLEGQDEMGDDLIGGEEEEGLNPLMIAVPAAAALAVGGYFLMNQGKQEKNEDKPLMDRLTMEGLQKDSEVQAAAAATAAVTGLGLYALLGGGGQTPVATGFLSSGAGMAATGLGATGVLGGLGYYGGKRMGWWGGNGTTPLTMEEYKKQLKTKNATALAKKEEFENFKNLKIEDETKHASDVQELEKKIAAAEGEAKKPHEAALKALKEKKTQAQIDAAETAMKDANNAVTEYEKKKPKEE